MRMIVGISRYQVVGGLHSIKYGWVFIKKLLHYIRLEPDVITVVMGLEYYDAYRVFFGEPLLIRRALASDVARLGCHPMLISRASVSKSVGPVSVRPA